jgi:hypothetical protein
MAKTKFRIVYEGSADCGDLDPKLVAQAFMLSERGDIGPELSLWETTNLAVVSVEAIEDDS